MKTPSVRQVSQKQPSGDKLRCFESSVCAICRHGLNGQHTRLLRVGVFPDTRRRNILLPAPFDSRSKCSDCGTDELPLSSSPDLKLPNVGRRSSVKPARAEIAA